MPTVLDETWAYSAGDLWVVTTNWTSNQENTGCPHTDGLGNVFDNIFPPDNLVGDAIYFNGFDCTTGNHFTISVPIKCLLPPVNTAPGGTNAGGGQRQIQIQVLDGPITQNTLATVQIATQDGGGSNAPSFASFQVFDADFNPGTLGTMTADLNGTLIFDLTAGVLTATYQGTLQSTLNVSVDTVLTTTTTPYFQFSAINTGATTQHPTVGFYGPLVMTANSVGPSGPTAPGTITASAVTETAATVSWVASTGGVGLLTYTVAYQDQTTPGSWITAGTTTALTFPLTGLAPGITYGVRVFATDTTPTNSTTTEADALFTTIPVGSFIQNMLVVRNVVYPGQSFPLISNPPLTPGPGVTNTGGVISFPTNGGTFSFIIPPTSPDTNTAAFSLNTTFQFEALTSGESARNGHAGPTITFQFTSALGGTNSYTIPFTTHGDGSSLPAGPGPTYFATLQLIAPSVQAGQYQPLAQAAVGTSTVSLDANLVITLNGTNATITLLSPGASNQVFFPSPHTVNLTNPVPANFPSPIGVMVTVAGNFPATATAAVDMS